MTTSPPDPRPAATRPTERRLRDRPGQAILLSLAATALFSVLWVCVKALSERYSIYEVTFFRNFMAIFPVMAMLAPRRHWGLVRTRRIGGHVWRAVVSVFGMLLGFMSYHLMPLADAVALSFMSPLAVTALSVPLLKREGGHPPVERGGDRLCRGAGDRQPVAAHVLGRGAGGDRAALPSAVASVTVRQLNKIDPPLTIVLYFTAFSTAFTALPLPAVWQWPGVSDIGFWW